MTVHRAMTVDCTVTVHRAVPYKGGRSYCTVERAISGERGERSRLASVCSRVRDAGRMRRILSDQE